MTAGITLSSALTLEHRDQNCHAGSRSSPKAFIQGENFMRIAVIGAGGVGGGFGVALAKAGADVTFVARGAHLAAMRANGLKLEGGRGDTLIKAGQATDDPVLIGPVDVVLFCVKLWDVETAGDQIRPIVGPDTGVISL